MKSFKTLNCKILTLLLNEKKVLTAHRFGAALVPRVFLAMLNSLGKENKIHS